ncbi:uncharacterized protein HMPREF1541_02028 [Cyphellophora europaea CBS 101466]|uniref:F-box domain-containing protein n=1 Tax=Cyphellophora europaea (strain CBS 101466) TaxID=1220924 RepID=W2S2S2_CYPE1|nr:uncharacterized protein HMPREF1541_02028 [Cyphellophora europaea CBS 101466]ETN42870.1 hypothetical protein HMPREF1541_02028 [Cyphellophora europaea CBS 101466]
MNLLDLLDYLYRGAYVEWTTLIHHLSNADIKSLRLIHRAASPDLFNFLFTRIYVSAHTADLGVFRRIACHPTARHHVQELMWDDCTFDSWIGGQQTYTDRLLATTTVPRHVLKHEQDAIDEAYRFWAAEATSFAENRIEGVDQQVFNDHVLSFPNLRSVVVLSRSRLTYVDPEAYWRLWQTPRTRIWSSKPFARYLLQPESFKPSTGTTGSQSEGIRPMRIIRAKARNDSSFRVGHLSINSIGGGQSRASGSAMINANRFDRKFHIDLQQLTSTCPETSRGKIALQLFLETQTEDMFRSAGVLEDNLDLLMMDTASSLESITVANICLDWFLDYSTIVNTQFPYLRTLKRVAIEGGSSDDPLQLLYFLARHTNVREVVFDQVHLETMSWIDVLQQLKQERIAFDVFELKISRAKTQMLPQPVETWTRPRTGFSDQIVSWLKGESEDFPLLYE